MRSDIISQPEQRITSLLGPNHTLSLIGVNSMAKPTVSPLHVGDRFGRLVVERLNHVDTRFNRFWVCACDCGKSAVVYQGNLRNGHTRSCGCLQQDIMRAMQTIHGGRQTPEYRTWRHMAQRCENPNTRGFKNYGGRGITVCVRWRRSFANFLADMGPRPSPFHSIDRINNDGNYTPKNCRWATKSQQRRNQRPQFER